MKRLMQSTQAAAMIQSRMWSDESQMSVELAPYFVPFICVATPTCAISAANVQ